MATGLACIPIYKQIAVSTSSGDLRFFNCSVYKFEHKFSIVMLPSIVVSLACYLSEKLVCGDFSGAVYVITMDEIFFQRLRRRAHHLGPQKITFDDIKKNRIIGLKCKFTEKSHFAPAISVKYISTIRAVISCSIFTKRSLLIHYIDHNESLNFSSEGGVTCFDFCDKLNFVATGSIDHTIRIWSPTINVSCRETLTGHFSSITHVIINNDKLFLISADREKVIRVWDVLRPCCLQVLRFKESDFTTKPTFSFLYLDGDAKQLIITTNKVAVLKYHDSKGKLRVHGKSELIIFANYSIPFDCIVTVGSDSSVAVWSMEANEIKFHFNKIHFIKDKLDINETMNVSAAILDPTGKRLISAGRDGSVKVWNFYLGICLQAFQTDFSILSLTAINFEIFVGGSAGQITTFYDDGTDTSIGTKWKILHKESIISMSCYSRNILATASSDGEILVWLWKNANAKLRMRDETNVTDENIETNYLAKVAVEKHKNCGINQICFLQSREMEPSVGNLISCGVDGCIRVWNVTSTNKENSSELLAKFKAVSGNYDGVVCLGTDKNNTVLFAGDTSGYLRTYDLEDYYSSFGSVPTNAREVKQRHINFYPFLRLQKLIEKKHTQYSKFDSEVESELGYAPLLLNCYRAHIGSILNISYCDEKMTVITASRKGSIRLWTLAGAYISELDTQERISVISDIPKDIRRVASILTLQVLNSGHKPHWDRAIQAMKKCRLGYVSEKSKEMPFCWMEKEKKEKQQPKSPEDFDLYQELEKRLKSNDILWT